MASAMVGSASTSCQFFVGTQEVTAVDEVPWRSFDDLEQVATLGVLERCDQKVVEVEDVDLGAV